MNAQPTKPASRSIAFTSIALLALWASSWGLSTLDLGRWALTAALAIAVVKAALVALIFMELLHVRASVRVIAATALMMLALLVGLVVVDVVARGV
jgi:cytochrome c oxidase subunit 4